eukprot:gnl/MRDRNA2_/MRDRNA2_66496_c0_seq2.p1 gnl/MRDRNA2_/MRDRNA2_66496_c0~~gnl/MRDRNA2_/MRDRNA2_66496_c0_seq2.p1  ORF type:complete len:202 (+),score=35.34 gnl/MRDRNA2_/MRDRNA2_66496_c0_seq2:310-915(+)
MYQPRRSWFRRLLPEILKGSSVSAFETLALCVAAAAPGLNRHLHVDGSVVASLRPPASLMLTSEALLDAISCEVGIVADTFNSAHALLPWVARPRVIGLVRASGTLPLSSNPEVVKFLEQHGSCFAQRDSTVGKLHALVVLEGVCEEARDWLLQSDEVWAVGPEAAKAVYADATLDSADVTSLRSVWRSRMPSSPVPASKL